MSDSEFRTVRFHWLSCARKRGGILDNETILAVDVGSSSVRAALYTHSGERLEGTECSLPYSLDVDREGAATKDAEELFGLFAKAIDRALELAGRLRDDIPAVAVSTFWHAVLGVDGEGNPTTPVLTWADRRSARCADELRRNLDVQALHRRTGCVPHSSYLPAKLLWLSRQAPEAFSRTQRWLSPGEYFYLRLFGETNVGVSMASATGLMHQNDKKWDAQTLEALPVTATDLSPISDEPESSLKPEWAQRWPALENAEWMPAAGDGACSNVGVGSTTGDLAALMVGTSGAMRVLWKSESVEIPPGLWCYRPDAERFVMGGALSDGGNLVAWLRQTLRLPELEDTEKEMASREPGSHGLDFLPLLAGERGPQWSDLANGAITGLSMATAPTDILHAAMEAVALRFALISRKIEHSLPRGDERRVIATGGGLSGSPAWTRMMADALGRPLTASTADEASSRGAALLAAESLGGPPIEEAKVPLGETVEPDQRRHEAYMEALERQTALYDALIGK